MNLSSGQHDLQINVFAISDYVVEGIIPFAQRTYDISASQSTEFNVNNDSDSILYPTLYGVKSSYEIWQSSSDSTPYSTPTSTDSSMETPNPTPSLTPSTPSPSPTPSPNQTISPIITSTPTQTQQPTLEPSPISDNVHVENYASILIIIGLGVATAVSVSLVVCFKRRK